MENLDITKKLSDALATISPVPKENDIESIQHAVLEPGHLATLMQSPREIIKSFGGQISEESQVHVTVKSRANRVTKSAVAQQRPIIIIGIHYRNCDWDIIIFY